MPGRISKAQRERFLGGRHVAVLVTIGPDGAPVPTPIWYAFHGGAFYFRTASTSAKVANVRRDPRVSVCVQDERAPYRAVIARGRAAVVESPPWLARELPRRYLGAVGAIGYRLAARAQVEQGPEVAIALRPERYTTSDFGAETPAAGRAWLWLKRVLPPWV